MFAAERVTHLPILLVIGFAIFAGTVGARLFQRLHIPRVVGYITIGLLAGQSGLRWIDADTIKILEPFNSFALGVIGFMVGGELHRDVFRKYGRQFFAILLAEGLGAFILVSLLVGAVTWLITGNLVASLALGIVFGAISSATAPAATVNVLWEYRTRGPLTTSVYTIVALDDGLALILYSTMAGIAGKLLGQDDGSLLGTLGHAAYELIGAAVLGVGTGLVLNFLLRRARQSDSSLALAIGAVALLMGAARVAGVDIILAAMALGVTLTNLAPRQSNEAFKIVSGFAPPIYVLFFVIAGAHINVAQMPAWMWGLAGAYLIGRTAGKIAGVHLGARLTGAAMVLRKYLGLCLFCQGGVAVGLAWQASGRFPEFQGIHIGSAIMLIIAVTTFVVETLGPSAVKYAVKKAGEVGLNVTEDDLIASYSAGDVMNRRAPRFHKDDTLGHILTTIAESDANCFPVVDADGKPIGVITLDELKKSLSARGMDDWLVAADLMQPADEIVTANTPLGDALARMRGQQLDFLLVVCDEEPSPLAGMLELRAVDRTLSQEILRRRKLADVNA